MRRPFVGITHIRYRRSVAFPGHPLSLASQAPAQTQYSLYEQNTVVLENRNVAQLGSNPYLVVHSLPEEDHHDTDDASAGEIYAVFVPESSGCAIQSLRRRQHSPSGVDRNAQTHRTAALYGMRPRILCTRGDLVG